MNGKKGAAMFSYIIGAVIMAFLILVSLSFINAGNDTGKQVIDDVRCAKLDMNGDGIPFSVDAYDRSACPCDAEDVPRYFRLRIEAMTSSEWNAIFTTRDQENFRAQGEFLLVDSENINALRHYMWAVGEGETDSDAWEDARDEMTPGFANIVRETAPSNADFCPKSFCEPRDFLEHFFLAGTGGSYEPGCFTPEDLCVEKYNEECEALLDAS